MRFNRLEAMGGEYLDECERSETESAIELCRHIEQDLINYRIRLIVGEVLKILVTNVSMKPVTHTRRDYIFQQFMLSLYSNFRQHHNVGYYAGNSGVSQKYFSTVIRELSGSTPSEWIEIVVVAEAKSLLSDINLSIKDIAGMLNFPDAPTFSKYFARSTGQTPKAYRRTLSPLNAGKR